MTAGPADAAASAWIERLPSSERLAAAAHTRFELGAWGLGLGLVVLVVILIARSGVVGALARRIERDGPRPWLASAAGAAFVSLAVLLLKAPFDALVAWRGAELLPGGESAPLAARLAEAASGALTIVALSIVLVPPLQVLAGRAPRTWPLWAGGAFAAVSLAIGWGPHAFGGDAVRPSPPPGLATEAVRNLVREAGLGPGAVVLAPTLGAEADVEGGARTAVLVGPGVLAEPPAEARATAAHVMGHFVHGDFLTIYLLYGILAVVVLVAVQRLTGPVASLLGEKGPAGPADPAGLPAALLVAVAGVTLAGLAAGAYIRWVNVGADEYALARVRDSDAMAAALERQWDHRSVDPSPLETAVFYTHPPLKDRLVHAMQWKATHGA